MSNKQKKIGKQALNAQLVAALSGNGWLAASPTIVSKAITVQVSHQKINRRSKTFRITLQGKRWTYTVLAHGLYKRREGEDSEAMTHGSKRKMVFDASKLSLGACRHELFHAYCTNLYLNSAEVGVDQFEEIVAEWAEDHLDEWIKKASEMYSKMRESEVEGT